MDENPPQGPQRRLSVRALYVAIPALVTVWGIAVIAVVNAPPREMPVDIAEVSSVLVKVSRIYGITDEMRERGVFTEFRLDGDRAQAFLTELQRRIGKVWPADTAVDIAQPSSIVQVTMSSGETVAFEVVKNISWRTEHGRFEIDPINFWRVIDKFAPADKRPVLGSDEDQP
jgi:hypothetical protein